MAQGVDLCCAQIVLDLRKKNPALKLHCVLPCRGEESKWAASVQKRYRSILAQANEGIYAEQKYNRDCMLKRNRYMVDHSSVLLAVYNCTRRSGTEATIRCALKEKRKVIIIDPVPRNISLQGFSDI